MRKLAAAALTGFALLLAAPIATASALPAGDKLPAKVNVDQKAGSDMQDCYCRTYRVRYYRVRHYRVRYYRVYRVRYWVSYR